MFYLNIKTLTYSQSSGRPSSCQFITFSYSSCRSHLCHVIYEFALPLLFKLLLFSVYQLVEWEISHLISSVQFRFQFTSDPTPTTFPNCSIPYPISLLFINTRRISTCFTRIRSCSSLSSLFNHST